MGFLSGLFGKKNGRYETYHENGQLQFRGIYVAGKPDGPFESYYENGQLKQKGTLVAGKQCGEWIEDGETVTYDPCPTGN